MRLIEIFAYIGFVVILFFHADKHRTIRLFSFLNDLVSRTVSVHCRFIMRNLLMVYLEKLLMGQTQIVFLGKTSV